jgi:hypothetical protein
MWISMPLVDFDSGILMTTAWLLLYLTQPAFQPMDDGLLFVCAITSVTSVRGVRPSRSSRSGMGMLARERGAAERESSDGHPDCCVKRCSHLCLLVDPLRARIRQDARDSPPIPLDLGIGLACVQRAERRCPKPVNLGGCLHPPFTLSFVAARRSD